MSDKREFTIAVAPMFPDGTLGSVQATKVETIDGLKDALERHMIQWLSSALDDDGEAPDALDITISRDSVT